MQRPQDLDPATRRRFQTGRRCLDLTHTGGEGEYARWELLHEPSDAARFLGIVLGTDPVRVRPRDMASIRRLRAAVTVIARSVAGGSEAPSDAIEVVNAAAARPSLVPRLTALGDSSLLAGSASEACSTLARDAIDLFSSPMRSRIRVCAADDCELLFVDASRPGRRRWCSMAWCGDRQKKRAAGRPVS